MAVVANAVVKFSSLLLARFEMPVDPGPDSCESETCCCVVYLLARHIVVLVFDTSSVAIISLPVGSFLPTDAGRFPTSWVVG